MLKYMPFFIMGILLLGGCSAEVDEKAASKPKSAQVETDQPIEELSKEEGAAEQISNTDEENQENPASEAVVQAVPEYRMKKDFSIQSITNPEEKVVLLTIDDAPAKYGLAMAQTLQALKVKAIFFVNGHFIDTPEEGEVLKKIHEMGFPIGNHTFNHKNLNDLTEEEQRQEIVGLNERIEELTGERPRFFRAPFGMNTDYSKQVAADENMLLMNWTYGYDWVKDYQSKEALSDIMINTPLLRNGANLLMHDREWTSAALEDIVKGLQAKGFKIVDPELIESPGNKETAAG